MKIKVEFPFEYGQQRFEGGMVCDVDADIYRHALTHGYAAKVAEDVIVKDVVTSGYDLNTDVSQEIENIHTETNQPEPMAAEIKQEEKAVYHKQRGRPRK